MGREGDLNKENVHPTQGSQSESERKSKKRKISSAESPQAISKKAPTLLTIPESVKISLMSYLDINSLEALSKTCRHFGNMIQDKFLFSVHLPFLPNSQFMEDMKEAKVIKKKAILKLECKKPRLTQNYVAFDLHPVFSQNPMSSAQKYIIDSQMSLLALQSLREVNLLPEEDPASAVWTKVHQAAMCCWFHSSILDQIILCRLSTQGFLANISRLDLLMVSSDMGELLWQQILPAMDSLRDLNITAVERCSMAGG